MPTYWEDVEVGKVYLVGGTSLSMNEVCSFAELSGDKHPIHIDPFYAAKSEFGQCVAHGSWGVARALGLFFRIEEFKQTAIALLDIRNWSFRKPVYVGDRVDLEMVVADKRLTSKGRGIVDRRMTLLNQHGDPVQSGYMALLVKRRADVAAI